MSHLFCKNDLTVMVYSTRVVPPTVVPNSKHEFEGEQAQEFSIRCSARGKPDPKYVFYKVILLA